MTDLKYYTSIGKFYGESTEDVEKYFRKIERYHVHANYDDAAKRDMLPFGLEGKALDFYEGCSAAIRADYAQVKTAMVNHFKSNKSEIVRWEELSKIKKLPHQSVAEFYDSIRKKADKIQGVTDRNLLMIFMGGLQNPLKNKVAAYEPNDLGTALEKAKLIESIESNEESSVLAVQNSPHSLTQNLTPSASAFRDEDMLRSMLEKVLAEKGLGKEKERVHEEKDKKVKELQLTLDELRVALDTKNRELETLRQVNNGTQNRQEIRPPNQVLPLDYDPYIHTTKAIPVVYPLLGRKCFHCGKKVTKRLIAGPIDANKNGRRGQERGAVKQ